MKLTQLNTLATDKVVAHFDFAKNDVTHLRIEALERFKALGLPMAKHEIFGKTGVRTIYDVDYLKDFKVGCHCEIPKSDNYRIVFRKGFFSPLQSSLPDCVKVRFETHPQLENESKNPFYLLAFALNRNFYKIEIEADVHLEKPIEIVYVDEIHASQNHMHVSVFVGEGSKVDIFERILIESASFFNHTLALHVATRAQVSHVHEQNAQADTHIISNYHYFQAKDTKANIYAYEKGSNLSISVWDIFLQGENAQMDFVALQLPTQEQHLSTIIDLHHDAPNTKSSQLIKQVINDAAKGVVDAKVVVSKNGAGTKSSQLCNSLILSDQAQVQSFVKPQLEIFIDDLEASHGATVGSLDEDQIYYLMSRGIHYERARELLIDAFSKQAYERFPQYAREFIGAK
ncbi:MAG: SufD family Fe-S cluster assembly protein [Sulfurospirillum sp.]|nr:SufD family Fe-S cluster assembly protein [Sulfurospirillum sp.]